MAELEGAAAGDSPNRRRRLPPMSHEGSPGGRTRLPPLDTQGASAAYTDAHIISVPEGEGAASRGGKGLISVPGDAASSYADRGQPSTGKPPIDIIVYFTNKEGLKLAVEDGQNMQAGELFELVKEEMKFADEARDMFSLWLVSDLLEVQLKPTHVPFKLACYWEELLMKYTTAEGEEIERDEPVIVFQRNVFYSRIKERKCKDRELLSLLYHEAKENVIDGRYPFPLRQASMLAGLQALIKHKNYESHTHNPDFYKNTVSEFFSSHFSRKKSLFSKREKLEEYIAVAHRNAYQKFGPLADESKISAVERAYLEFCWELPYYGAAFFRGQIEHPGTPLLRSVNDDPVYIAVNPAGVFIIDLDDVVFLVGLLYEKMSWEYAEPKNQENPDCLPCLFLTFTDIVGQAKYTKVLQVFSREAKLADALIETCVKLRIETRKNSGEDETDGIRGGASSGNDDGDGVIESEGKQWMDFNRLCLTTFDSNGRMIDCQAKKAKNK